MSSLDGAEGAPLLQPCSPDAPDGATGPPDPHQGPKLREETEAAQVMAESGEGSLEAVAPPRAQLPEEEGASHDPAACGHGPQFGVGGGRSFGAPEAELEQAPPPAGAQVAESVAMATDRGLNNGCRPGELRGAGAERPEAEVVAEAKAADEAMVEKEGEEERVMEQEVEVEKPVGEVVEMAEANRAVAEAEANRAVAEVMEGARRRPLNVNFRPLNVNFRVNLRMNPLEAIQQELDAVNAQADRAFQQLEQKFGRMRRHYLERRNYIIQNIPGFWVTAFRNHPQLAPMIRGQDAEMLRYITHLEVKEFRHPKTGCKFKFFFRRNPFFRNKLIVKEYEVRASGRVVSLSTPIVWRRGHEPQSFIRRNQDVVCNFFTWFSDHSLPESDKIAEIIKEDLWPNPLQYYLLQEGVRRVRRRPIREPVEIPRPFGFQSG